METESQNTDTKFVRAFFALLAWLFSTLPPLYAIYSHSWLMLVLLLCAEAGVVVSVAIKNMDD